ncbi:FxsB family cyclophane-forming radical SAM/SPASM peptide maturase [Nocardia sp. NPDC050710]|uniref:FxsB family cyclophane-forming radical SAM/SPASM peptide maturase n=1 Tax=Nocardia sp. NPDC050710 TaxID=3157220 RepID=UPI00340C7D01
MESVPVPWGLSRQEKLWPASGLDLTQLRGRGWEPPPFTEFVLEIHGRCGDYCSTCAVADRGWCERPETMSRTVFADACRMIGEHARRCELPAVDLLFHGGEPLMVGHENLAEYARLARELLEPITKVRIGMRTNGVLLDEEFVRICDRWGIRIAVGLDGDRIGNDRHRREGRSTASYARVVAGLAQLVTDERRHLFSGLLCTIDIANDPVDTYESLLVFDPPVVDFRLPHGDWTTPPPNPNPGSGDTPYGNWLIEIFDRWYPASVLEPRVRLFDDIIELLLGGRVVSESVGLQPIRRVVIDTDGTLGKVDDPRSASAVAAVSRAVGAANPLDRALWEPSMVARRIGVEALSDTCRRCPIHTICGGGQYAHRYRADNGFRNPSVYCADLTALIMHIGFRLRADHDTALGE